jgi:hypothetical protein
MTLGEIYQHYPNEWVVIEFTGLDENLKVLDGQVVAHSPSKDEIDRVLTGLHQEKLALEFTGKWDDEVGYLL